MMYVDVVCAWTKNLCILVLFLHIQIAIGYCSHVVMTAVKAI